MTIKQLTLTEFQTQHAVQLLPTERDSLRRLHPGLRVEPTVGGEHLYDLTPDQRVGLVVLPSLRLEIRPKVPMQSVLFLLSYACDQSKWSDQKTDWGDDCTLVELVAAIFARLVERATHRGLINGYRAEQESLQAPRGRIQFDEQLRRRLGMSPPVEVVHDLFTADIPENRLLLSALNLLSRLPSRSAKVRRELGRARRVFGSVSHVRFSPSAVPEVQFTRLNRHYQPAIALATIILRSASIDLGSGSARGAAFLIDMNVVFESFTRISLREALAASEEAFPKRPPRLRLDEAGVVPLAPDLCLLDQKQIVWVGDAKYKRLPTGAYRNADIYQMLAYTTALNLPSGTLIYAAHEGVSQSDHAILSSHKQIRVRAIDLTASPAGILRQMRMLAEEIEAQRSAMQGMHLRT